MTSGPATSVAANGESDGYPDVVSTRRSSDAISAGALAGSTGSARARSKSARTVPSTPAAPGWHGEPHRVPLFRLLAVPSARLHDHGAPVACEIAVAAQSMDRSGPTTTVISFMTFVLRNLQSTGGHQVRLAATGTPAG